MKKLNILFITTIILATSCSTEEYYNEVKQQELKPSYNKRTYSEALEIANNAISMLSDDAVTRGGFPRKINERNGVKYITNTITRSGNPDTLLYIFNYEGEEGYAVVSANKNTDGLLAVTESGSYDPTIGTDNPGLAMFMDMAEDYVLSKGLVLPERPPFLKYKIVKDTISYINIGKKVNLKWGQKGIYGYFCPNQTSGCSITAAGMAMSYFRNPTTININYNPDSIFTLNLNWDNICLHTGTSCNGCSQDTHHAIGKLLRQLGHMSSSTYNSNGLTNTYRENLRNTLISIGYTASPTTVYTQDGITTALNNGHLILMRGLDETYGGHMWIVDGVYECVIQEQDYSSENAVDWIPMGEPTFTSTKYNHINWGWDGCNNGNFNAGVFEPNNYRNVDDPYLTTSLPYNFSSDFYYFSIYH